MKEIGSKPLSIARTVDRVPNANSMENKIARRDNSIEFVRNRVGCFRIYVDESHWKIGDLRSYAWGEVGTADASVFEGFLRELISWATR